MESDHIDDLAMGFRILANYIFDGNKKRKSIAMTIIIFEKKIKGLENFNCFTIYKNLKDLYEYSDFKGRYRENIS